MNKTRRARLEPQGWQVGNAAEFLELTPEEAAYVDLKLPRAWHSAAVAPPSI